MNGLMQCNKRSAACAVARLFDYLVGTREQRRRHRETKCLRCLEVDDQFYFRSLLHRQLARLRTLEKAAGIDAYLAIHFRIVNP
jgi:hypothetical protein